MLEVFLLVITMTDGGSPRHTTYEMPSWEICQESVKNAQIKTCSAGDCENSIALSCVGSKR